MIDDASHPLNTIFSREHYIFTNLAEEFGTGEKGAEFNKDIAKVKDSVSQLLQTHAGGQSNIDDIVQTITKRANQDTPGNIIRSLMTCCHCDKLVVDNVFFANQSTTEALNQIKIDAKEPIPIKDSKSRMPDLM